MDNFSRAWKVEKWKKSKPTYKEYSFYGQYNNSNKCVGCNQSIKVQASKYVKHQGEDVWWSDCIDCRIKTRRYYCADCKKLEGEKSLLVFKIASNSTSMSEQSYFQEDPEGINHICGGKNKILIS